jgi:flagellar basal body-associated protein FliL
MAKDKDLNPDTDQNSEAKIKAMDFNEIDQAIAAEDPQFLKQVSEIKINSSGVDLSAMEQTLQVKQAQKISFKDQIKAIFNYSKNPKNFFVFWLTTIGVIALLVFTWGIQKNFLHQKLFLNSFAELGPTVRDYNPLTETVAFYDNPKFSKNIVTLSKMFINLKSSENSGPRPMLALEINVEGISADAIIEIKDREAEFKDLLLRYTEEKTYDELLNTNGKKNLCELFRQIINSHLTRGQVRKVLLNSFIIKP